MQNYYVYIMTGHNRRLYVGVTNDLERRVQQHKSKLIPGFTSRYNLTQLVYYERLADIRDAIAREKCIKGWARAKKLDLIEAVNPGWHDLAGGIEVPVPEGAQNSW
jgi:putative endonuclease